VPILSARSVGAGSYGLNTVVATPFVNAGAFEALATATVTTATSTIIFSGIPSTYSHLQLRGIARSSNSTGSDAMLMQFNNDAGTNYDRHSLLADGTNISAGGLANQNWMVVADLPNSAVNANYFASTVIDIPDYASTVKTKIMKAHFGINIGAAGSYYQFRSGTWFATPAAISTITLSINGGYNFTTGTTVALYGVK